MSVLKSAFLGGFSWLGLPKEQAVILMYHSVSPGADYFMNVEPRDFERHMEYIKKSGRPVIALGELVRRLKTEEVLDGAIVITFDDGYRDNYTIAFPLLQRYGFPATIFVTTDLIGKSDKRDLERLTIAEMKEMEASGLIAIEPHTRSHPRLSKLDPERAREEIVGAKQYLESQLQKSCQHFAYPYGDFNDETEKIVGEVFESACSVSEGTVRKGMDPRTLRRVSIDRSTTFPQFRGKLTRAIDLWRVSRSIGI